MTEVAFSDNPFMIGYDNRVFEEDEELGFRFPEGKLVGKDRFIDLDDVVLSIKRNSGYPIILNMGDSSTSGWNGNKVFKGDGDPNAPFFTYETYSDLLRNDPSYESTVNAGVPGYSSLQGRKYLERLLKRFSREGINVDYVTLYFGNNDATYNRVEDKVRLEAKKESSDADGERVTVRDYSKNMELMIDTTREYGSKPIIIIPPIHYDWEPGIRSDAHRDESLESLKEIEGTDLEEELEIARELYHEGEYRQSSETDRVLPRLKKSYRKILLKSGRKTRTPIIDVQRRIPYTDNGEYFADYCHPLPKINQMIAEDIVGIRRKDIFHKPVLNMIRSSVKNLFKDTNKKRKGLESKTYTIY